MTDHFKLCVTVKQVISLILHATRNDVDVEGKACLRTFALIVCAQPFCAGNATAICHASLRLTGPEDKHGVENTGEKNFRPSLLLWIIGDPYFFKHESLTLLTIYKI